MVPRTPGSVRDSGPDSSHRDFEKAYEHQRDIIDAIGVSSPDFTYVFDRDQRFVYVSPPLLKLWGKTLEEAIGMNFAELGYPQELVALHKQQLDDALTGKTVSGSNTYVNPAGVEGHYEYTFVPVFDDDGAVAKIVGTTRDVTPRVLADREHAQVMERLRDSEEQFRHFADAMPQLAWIAHADGHIFWYNRRWHEYTGTTPAQMEGWGWQSVHDPSELPRVLERWKACIATGEPFEMSFPLRGADDQYRWFLTRSTPVRDGRGALVRWLGTNTDIDAQRKTIEERDTALAAAEEAIRLRDEFLSIASHELKTPLTGLLLGIQSLQRMAASDPALESVRPGLERARASGQRLDRLIVELLDVSRLAVGKPRLELGHVDLSVMVKEVCDREQQRATSRGGALRVSAEASIVGTWDAMRLEQVVTKLLDNALKYGGTGPIDVELVRRGKNAVLRVEDRGIGIPPAHQRHIFERFRRAVSARQYGGFGLGLWIVHQIVEASGGTIEVTSIPGEGATFTVTLPIVDEHSHPDVA